MDVALISTYLTAHVFFRLMYLFVIGGILRERMALQRDQSQLKEWKSFRERAEFILHLDVDLFIGATVLSSCWGGGVNCFGVFNTVPNSVWIGVGGVLILVGGYAKWDAYRIIGDRGWYWYNFFCAPDETDFEKRGVYKWLNNPMYGVGYLPLFGLAFLLLSEIGLILAAFDWMMIWLFYYYCERPHTKHVLRENDGEKE